MKLADLLCYHYPLYAQSRRKGVSDQAIIAHASAVIPEEVTSLITNEGGDEWNPFKTIASVAKGVFNAGKAVVKGVAARYGINLTVTPKPKAAGNVTQIAPLPKTEPAPFPIWIPIVGGAVLLIVVIIIAVVSGKKKK